MERAPPLTRPIRCPPFGYSLCPWLATFCWRNPLKFWDERSRPVRDALRCELQNVFTKERDGLVQNWGTHAVLCNPLRRTDARWARKCHAAALNGATVALPTHTRTDTRRVHDWVYRCEADPVRTRPLEIRRRQAVCAFPSMVAIFKR